MYLFVIQFVVTTILAIVLSNVFVKISQTNNEEFEYLKTINLMIYLKWSSSQRAAERSLRLVRALELSATILKMPIILFIYFYETWVKENKMLLQKQHKDLKKFTFLNREDDLYGDSDMAMVVQGEEEDSFMWVLSRTGARPQTRHSSYDVCFACIRGGCSRQPHRHKASGLRAAAALARDFGGVPKRTDGLGLHRRVP